MIIIFFLGVISCRKNEDSHTKDICSQQPTKHISEEYAQFKFKKGTYWVFIDSISLSIDTLMVDSISLNGIYPYNFCSNNYHEIYVFMVKHHPNGYTWEHFLVQEENLKYNPDQELYPAAFAPYTPKIDSMFIYDRYYKSVAKANITTYGGQSTYLYLNLTYGILRKDVYNYSNQLISKWLLKDKFIVR